MGSASSRAREAPRRPTCRASRPTSRSAPVAFGAKIATVDERYVDRVAGAHNISLRTGCFCNPGAGEVAFTISRETLVGGEFGEGMTLDDYIRELGLHSGGAIRASLGLASNLADLHRFIDFAGEFSDLRGVPDNLPPRQSC